MKSPKPISRSEFLNQVGVLGTAAALTRPVLAKSQPMAESPPVLPDRKIRLAVIGCGSVSNMYLPHLSKSPYVELVSTCDIIPERAQKAATTYNIPNHYPHIDQLLAGAPFDLLVNLTNMQEHGRLNKQALLAGKHIWSEKPMANNYREGRELLELAQKNKLRIWGAPAVVMSPQFAFMARAIKDGKLGNVSAAHAHYGHLGPTWSAFFYEKGGGSLPDLGVYNLATLTGLLGPARSIVAMTSIVTPTRKTDNKETFPVEAEDNAMVLMDHGNGILSHVQCGFNYFDPYGHEGTGQEKPTITVWGTQGNLALIGYDWAPFGVDLATVADEKGQRYVTDPSDYRWEMGASVIAEHMALGKEPLIQAEHALHVLEIIEAARSSGQTGRRVKLQSSFRWPLV
ncbi:gfo/Idh/MocA family oxidoreductase [Fibrisoma montanum]|uniref:Gfo/Idh/MocA family oxidoreductase n=1 Tax=Fibrisoma montanum TaxID=2305895 RepID=A0A418M8Q1_9BACT|nr:Gfo/Idh/MocA family oxidoreductase [Fibrisoma montanum]RIV22459.1 gfo/Idh/MocA family oxidoreductase [Fibrisoma montanum]